MYDTMALAGPWLVREGLSKSSSGTRGVAGGVVAVLEAFVLVVVVVDSILSYQMFSKSFPVYR